MLPYEVGKGNLAEGNELRIKKKIEGATIKETRSVGTTLHVGGTTHGVSGRAVLA